MLEWSDAVPHNVLMPRKKPTSDESPKNRHKPSRMSRIRERLAAQLDILAQRNETSIVEEADRAVRLLLEQSGLWPPNDGLAVGAKDGDA